MRVILPILIPLAACQPPSDAGGNAAAANATAPRGYSEVQRRVLGLSPQQRQGVFLRAIRDGDAPCQGVTEEVRQEDQGGNPIFVATCGDGPVYAVAIDREGTAQVTRLSAQRR